MVVQHGAEQVVGSRNGVHIPGEVEIDVLHRNHLRVTAAGGSPLDAENRPQRRLPQGDDRLFPQLRHGFAQADGGGGFPLAGGGGVDGGKKDQLAVRAILHRTKQLVRDLRFVFSVIFQILFRNVQRRRYLSDGTQLRLLGNFNVCQHRKNPPIFFIPSWQEGIFGRRSLSEARRTASSSI